MENGHESRLYGGLLIKKYAAECLSLKNAYVVLTITFEHRQKFDGLLYL